MKKYLILNLLILLSLYFLCNFQIFLPLFIHTFSIGKFVVEAYCKICFLILLSVLIILNFEFIAPKKAPALYRKKYFISILFIIIGLLVGFNAELITPKMAPAKYAKWFNDDMWRGTTSMENWSSKESNQFIHYKVAYDNRVRNVLTLSIILFLVGVINYVYYGSRRLTSYFRKQMH